MIQPDELFSYWIFAWYIVYMFASRQYKQYRLYSPKFALFIANLANLFVLVAMIYFKVQFIHILYFILVIVVFKIIPLWTLRHERIHPKEVQATFAVLLLYIGWICWKGQVYAVYQGYVDLLQGKQSMPGMALLEYLHT